MEVEERCGSGGSAYGGEGNRRTEKRYYPRGLCTSPSAGRLSTVKTPDGKQDTYTYEYGMWQPGAEGTPGVFTAGSGSAVRVLTVHGTVSNPAGIAYKTTRTETVYDSRGCKVFTGEFGYDAYGQRVTMKTYRSGSNWSLNPLIYDPFYTNATCPTFGANRIKIF